MKMLNDHHNYQKHLKLISTNYELLTHLKDMTQNSHTWECVVHILLIQSEAIHSMNWIIWNI